MCSVTPGNSPRWGGVCQKGPFIYYAIQFGGGRGSRKGCTSLAHNGMSDTLGGGGGLSLYHIVTAGGRGCPKT